MGGFADYLWFLLPRPLRHPSGLAASEIGRLVDVLGGLLDDARDAGFQVRRAWFPQTAAGAALDLHGAERELIRWPGESDDAYRARLVAAFELHQAGGTIPGMVLAMETLGHAGARVIEPREANIRLDGACDLDGSWTLGSRLSWALFEVAIQAPADGLSADELARILHTVRTWKPAHTRLAALVLELGDLLEDAYPETPDAMAVAVALAPSDPYAWAARLLDGTWSLGGSVPLDQRHDTLTVEVLPA